ncbi:MAG: PDZ domain-containing protein [Bacteroidetes bacterium]|nr:MAG: PDZ domain-containing protein [Bacteroidota bacterium]
MPHIYFTYLAGKNKPMTFNKKYLFYLKITIPTLILIIILISAKTFVYNRYQFISQLLYDSVSQNHYDPPLINDDYSSKVFDLWIKRLDYGKKFLIKSDIEQLSVYKKELDDQWKNHSFEFFDATYKIIQKRISEAESWYKEILSQPLDYNKEEHYETDMEKTKYAENLNTLKEEWRKMLKYQVLLKIDELKEEERKKIEKDSTHTLKPSPFDTLEYKARQKVLKSNNDWFKRLKKLSYKDRISAYLNTFINVYDPHTEYFPPKEKKKFDQSMSGQFEGIGARLQQKDGVIKVVEIIVGSPSYKQGELKAGDIILKVAQGEKEPVDVTDMDIDEAIELIKGPKGTEVRLTVQKPDGTIKVIPIIRDVIEMEETYAKSFIIEQDNEKYGYIYLPSFYTDFTHTGAHHCSQDVKKEIEKLKKYNIKGLILDLRDNGGGSLQEAVDLTGLFIDQGPVVQVRGKMNYVTIQKDKNPGVTWSGPLSVLINHGSASASEIVSAALQDYKRAIIIGTNSYGKGTVQSFVDLDYYVLPGFDSIKPVGSVKITMQKFYRINGDATQLKGVEPDIKLPNIYQYIDDYGEKELDYPMPFDKISPVNYNTFNNINYDIIKKNAATSIKNNPAFKLIEKQAEEYRKRKLNSKINLQKDKFFEYQENIRKMNKEYEDNKPKFNKFNIIIPEENKVRFDIDTAKAGRETRWAKQLEKDAYVYETTKILKCLK